MELKTFGPDDFQEGLPGAQVEGVAKPFKAPKVFGPDDFIEGLPPGPVAPIAEPAKPKRTILGTAGDIAISGLKGVISVPQIAVGLADIPTGGRAGKFLEEKFAYRPQEAKDILSTLYSPAQQAAMREVEEAEGFIGTTKEAIMHPSVIAHAGVEAVAPMLAGGAIARGVVGAFTKVAPWIAAAIGEGTVATGLAAEDIRQQTETGLLTPKQSAMAIASGLGTGVFNIVGGRLAIRYGFTDVDTFLATAKKTVAGDVVATGAKNIAIGMASKVKDVGKRIVLGGIAEGVFEELPQSVQEQVWSNAALGLPLTQNVANAAAMGMLTGAAMGAGINILTGAPTAAKEDLERLSAIKDLPIATEEDLEGLDVIKKYDDIGLREDDVNTLNVLSEGLDERDIEPADILEMKDDENFSHLAPYLDEMVETHLAVKTPTDLSESHERVAKEAITEVFDQLAVEADQFEQFLIEKEKGIIPTEEELQWEKDILAQREGVAPAKIMQARIEAELSDVERLEMEERRAGVEPSKGLVEKAELDQKLDAMQNEVASTKTAGVTQEIPTMEKEGAIVYSADSPQWMQQLQSARKVDKKKLLSRKELNVLFDKTRAGKELTDIQADQYLYLERAIEGYAGEVGEFRDEAEALEKMGYEPMGGQRMAVADLNEGDKFIGTVDGMEDEFEVLGTNEKGETLLQNGIKKRIDIFDEVIIEGIKRKSVEEETVRKAIAAGEFVDAETLRKYPDIVPKKDITEEPEVAYDREDKERLGREIREREELRRAISEPERGKKEIEDRRILQEEEKIKEPKLGGLFDKKPAKMEQLELFKSGAPLIAKVKGEKPVRRVAAKVEVGVETTGNIMHDGLGVASHSDAAALLSHLLKSPQEKLFTVTVDKKGAVIEIHSYSKGAIASSVARPIEIAGRVLRHPNASRVYFVHNHPAGSVSPSPNDQAVYKKIKNILKLRGIDLSGVILGINDKGKGIYDTFNETVFSPETYVGKPVKKTIKKTSLPVKERVFVEIKEKGPRITPATIDKYLTERSSGFLFMDAKNRETGYLEYPAGMAARKMSALVFATAEKTNAAAMIILNKEGHVSGRQAFFEGLSTGLMASGLVVHEIVTIENGKIKHTPVEPAVGEEGFKIMTTDIPQFQTTEDRKQTKTKAFKKWFGGSKVVDENGEPLVVYHGTPRGGFSEFNIPEKFGSNTFWANTQGAVFFVADPEIADTFSKIGSLGHKSYHSKYPSAIYPVFLNIKNPFIMDAIDFSEHEASELYETAEEDALSDVERLVPDDIYEQIQTGEIGDYLDIIADPAVLPEDFVEVLEKYQKIVSEGAGAFSKTPEDWAKFYKDIKNKGYDGILIEANGDLAQDKAEFGADNYIIFNPTQIKSATGNIGAFDPTDPDIRFQADQMPGQGIDLKDIQKQFKGQQVFISEDGSISIRMENRKGFRIKNIKEIRPDSFEYAVQIGQVSKEGLILGGYKDGTIFLDKYLADIQTLSHETYHGLKDYGMITPKESLALRSEASRLQKTDDLDFNLSKIKEKDRAREENEANMFSQILKNRETYRDTKLGRIVQKVMDFLDGLRYIGRSSIRKLAKQIETGKIFERKPTKEVDDKIKFQISEDKKLSAAQIVAESKRRMALKRERTNTTNQIAEQDGLKYKGSAEKGQATIENIMSDLRRTATTKSDKVRSSIIKEQEIIEEYRKLEMLAKDSQASVSSKQKMLASFLKILPINVRTKVITPLSFISRFKQIKTHEKRIDEALSRAEKELSIYLRRTIVADIIKDVRKKKLAKSRIKKGTIGHEAERDLQFIREVLKEKNIESRMSQIENQIERKEAELEEVDEGKAKIVEEEISDLQSHMNIIETFGDIKSQKLEDLLFAKEALGSIILNGRALWRAQQDAFKEMLDPMTANVQRDISGQEEPTLETSAEATKRAAERAAAWGKAKGTWDAVENSILSWEFLMNKLSKLSDSKILQSYTTTEMGSIVQSATKQENILNLETDSLTHSNAKRIFNAKSDTALNKKFLAQEIKQTGKVFSYNKEGKKVDEFAISQMEAAYMHAIRKNPDSIPTFDKMGMTEQTFKDIENFIGPELKAWVDYNVDVYLQDFHFSVNDVYRQVYGTNLTKTPGYISWYRDVPGKVQDKGIAASAHETGAKGMSKGAFKERIKNTNPYRFMSFNDVLIRHISEMNNFKAWAMPTKIINSVFNNRKTQRLITQHHSVNMRSAIKSFQTDFTKSPLEMRGEMAWLDKLRGNITTAMTALNPTIFLKQLTSIPAMAESIPTEEWIKHEVAFWTNPLKAWNLLKESKHWKSRRLRGMERDIRTAQAVSGSQAVANVRNIKNRAMFLVKWGDGAAILVGGYPVYKHHFDKNLAKMGREKAHQLALTEFETAMDRTQQASGIKDQGKFQRSGSYAKLFSMFLTAPKQYTSQITAAIRKIHSDPTDGDAYKRLFIFGVMMPSLFQATASGLIGLIGGDDDDEKKFISNQIKAILQAPLNGIPIIRDLQKGVWESAMGEWYGTDVEYSPVTEAGQSLLNAVFHGAKLVASGDITPEKRSKHLEKTLNNLFETAGYAYGLPAETVRKMFMENWYDIITGETDYPFRRGIGFSRFATGERVGRYKRNITHVRELNKRIKEFPEEREELKKDKTYVMLPQVKRAEAKIRKLNKRVKKAKTEERRKELRKEITKIQIFFNKKFRLKKKEK